MSSPCQGLMYLQCLQEHLWRLKVPPQSTRLHLEYLQVLHHLNLMNKVMDLQALLLQHMGRKTSGISGGGKVKVLQNLDNKFLQVAMLLQRTNSRPLDG